MSVYRQRLPWALKTHVGVGFQGVGPQEAQPQNIRDAYLNGDIVQLMNGSVVLYVVDTENVRALLAVKKEGK